MYTRPVLARKLPLPVIAGPCSAETPAQLELTAACLRDEGVEWFRAGLWKPRTSPGCFEGVGEKGIAWMQEVRNRFGMKICTEVASAAHVELCLKAGFDMLWLGARTTTSPFLVQEVAEALSGAPVKLFVKNPVNPDRKLWAGAVERLRIKGVNDISLIYRGVSSFGETLYRNDPCWGFAIEFRTAFPDIPFYCDPSHIAGNAAYVPILARKAVDLGLDGLMVECHCRPQEALSDSAQQLTPDEFSAMVRTLAVRRPEAEDACCREEMESVRRRIDVIDDDIITLISERMEASRQMGRLKKEAGVAILQTLRWEEVIGRVRMKARNLGIDPAFVEKLFNEIHEASVSEQNSIISQL